jgi:hypothetical protein
MTVTGLKPPPDSNCWGGQAGHPHPAGGLLPLRLAEPRLGDLVRRRGALLVHLGLVVALDQDLGLGL